MIVNDLRAFLLEVAGEPPRLKQDRTFFAKELPRFLDTLEPQPTWLPDDWRFDRTTERTDEAGKWALALGLIGTTSEGKEIREEHCASHAKGCSMARRESLEGTVLFHLHEPSQHTSQAGYVIPGVLPRRRPR